MREQFERINDPRSETFSLATKLNLPTSYLLIHRTWLGGIGLLSQLGATAPFREILEESHVIFGHDDDTLGPAGHEEWQAFVQDSEGNSVGLVELRPTSG